MDYYLYKLRFDGAVHFGMADSATSLQSSSDHFCADTLFSALCHTAGTLWGGDGIEVLCEQADTGRLLLSDSMRHFSDEAGSACRASQGDQADGMDSCAGNGGFSVFA